MRLNQWKSLLTTSQNPLQLTRSAPGQPLQTLQTPQTVHPAAQAFLQALLSQKAQSEQSQEMKNPKLYETLQALADRAASGEINGIGVFWADPDGYSCFISNISGDAFGLFGYIRASSQFHMQNFLDKGLEPQAPPTDGGPGPTEDDDDETEDFV